MSKREIKAWAVFDACEEPMIETISFDRKWVEHRIANSNLPGIYEPEFSEDPIRPVTITWNDDE